MTFKLSTMFRLRGRGGSRAQRRRGGEHAASVAQDGVSASNPVSGSSQDNIHGANDDNYGHASHGSSSEASSQPTHSNGSSSRPLHRSASQSQIGLDEYVEQSRDFTARMVNIEFPFGKPIEEVYSGVHNGKILGKGVSGPVRLVIHKATGHQFAVKCLDLRNVDSVQGLRQLREEISIMCELDHPNIVRLEEVYESHVAIYLVQELCVGGELFDRLGEQPDDCFAEAECARMVKQMLSAVRYLHSKGIVHRDLKLENFLLTSKSPHSDLVLVDFGLSKHFKSGEVQRDPVGTPYTVAPEVIRGDYDERCDVWALGVLSFLLLSGDTPFGGCHSCDSLRTIRSNILSGAFAYERAEVWSVVSDEAKAFVEEMLVTNPKRRPSVEQVQSHPWLRKWGQTCESNAKALDPKVVSALESFKDINFLRKLFAEVLSFTLLPDQLSFIRKEFEKVDLEGTGEIALDSLKQILEASDGASSVGALTDEDIEHIFNAMRVGISESRVHWHEFVAAALPLCRVDQRNVRLAFDRLDCLHNGYIAFDDIMELMGGDDLSSEVMRDMWNESLQACDCQRDMLTLQDFSFLVSGSSPSQNRADPQDTQGLGQARDAATTLQAVNELEQENDGECSYFPPLSFAKYSRRRCRSLGDTDDDKDDEEGIPLLINGEPFLPTPTSFGAQRSAPGHIDIDQKHDGTGDATTAGLVLRHGARKHVDSDAARAWLRNMEKEQEALVRKVSKRSGRRRNFSDITGVR